MIFFRLVFPMSLFFISVSALNALAISTSSYDISSLQKSVYKISYQNQNGTAFAIGPHLFVTNFHVIKGMSNHSPGQILLSNIKGKKLSFDKVIRLGNSEIDLALFTTKEKVESYLKISNQAIPFGEPLFSLSYTNGKLKKINMREGISHRLEHFYRIPYNFSYLNLSSYSSKMKGASGSPLFNQKGEVVTVIYQGSLFETLISPYHFRAVLTQDLQNFIKGNIGVACSNKSLRLCIEDVEKSIDNKNPKTDLSLKENREQISTLKALDPSSSIKISFSKENREQIRALKALDPSGSIFEIINFIKSGDDGFYQLAIELFELEGHQSIKRIEEALNKGLYKAQLRFDIAKIYLLRGDYQKAISLFEELRDKGHGPSFFVLGEIYIEGLGVLKNYKTAKSLFEQALRAGYEPAFIGLGKMYQEGLGVKPDPKKAKELFEQALRAGHKAPAQLKISSCGRFFQ